MTLDGWGNLAQEWRDTYRQFTKSLAENSGLPWKTVDEHHLDSPKQLIVVWRLEGLWTSEIRALSLIWHRLNPRPDSSMGIKELNKLF
jgi:2-haloacid dehalogenase